MVSDRTYPDNRWLFLPVAILFVFTGYFLAMQKISVAIFIMLIAISAIWVYYNRAGRVYKTMIGFLDALNNEDTAIHFADNINVRSLKPLYERLNRLNLHFQNIRLQNESNEKYYRTLIRHSATGILVLGSENKVELINRTACGYAGISPDSLNPDLLQIRNPRFFDAVTKIRPGQDITYKQISGSNFSLLSFKATELRKGDETVKMISIQDIRNELEINELESYRKLIRVLTHEIMNLMAPLTAVSKELYTLYTSNTDNNEKLRSTEKGLHLINEQANAITHFVNNYRKLSRIPQPVFEPIDAEDWADQLRIIYTGMMNQNQIEFCVINETGKYQFPGDKNLLNQVIFNFLNNAMDAVLENPTQRLVSIKFEKSAKGRFVISIRNNGPAISNELREKIFIPFFTTKQQGSGIGLSICQEIIKLHHGKLNLDSGKNEYTTFYIEL